MRRAVLLLCLPLLPLAACDRGESEKVDSRPQPVLPGSVSDAMLQTDSLRAQAPLAEPVATGSPGAEPADAEAEEGARTPPRRPRRREAADAPRDKAAPEARTEGEPGGGASPSPRPTRSPRPTPTP